jgi:exosortase
MVAGRKSTLAMTALFCGAGLLWAIAIHQLGFEWSVNPQYGFGWLVPPAALISFVLRWRSRPMAIPLRGPARKAALAALILLCGVFLPVRIVQEASPDWRVIHWLVTIEILAVIYLLMLIAWGRGVARHFLFPVFSLLVAVPWPAPFENEIVYRLSSANASVAAEILAVFGVPAMRRGNVIEVSSGVIGVEEACSGIRSFQACLAIAVFAGEFFRLRFSRRCVLVFAGAGLALVGNLARTLILVGLAARSGISAVDRWHDLTGAGILLAALSGLWILALFFQSKNSSSKSSERSPMPEIMPGVMPVALAVVAWAGIVEAGNQWWYRTHERLQKPPTTWTVSAPKGAPDFRRIPLPNRVWTILKFNQGEGAAWRGSDGRQIEMFFLLWRPGRTAARLAGSHRPEICLPASGRVLKGGEETRVISVQGLRLPFRAYRFDENGKTIRLFHCLWEDRGVNDVSSLGLQTIDSAKRLSDAWEGRRQLGQRLLQILVEDAGQEDAWNRLQDVLREIVRLDAAKDLDA